MRDYKKILVLQTAFLGDVILTTPLIRALKETYPNAVIDVLVIPQTCIVLKHNPHIRKIICFDKRKLSHRIRSFFSVLSAIRNERYELAVSAHLSSSTSILMYLARIPERIGFSRQKLLTKSVYLPKGLPIIKRYLRLMTALTDKEFDSQTQIYWSQSNDTIVDKLLSNYREKSKFLVGIAPGSVWPTKCWPAEYYAELIALLMEKGIASLLIGGKEDYYLCRTISEKSGVNPLILAGKLSILGSAALIQRLRLLVTNDSAPLHLANAVKTDVVAIFGPTVNRFGFFPFRENDRVLEIELDCRPCGKHGGQKCPEGHFLCMRDILPQTVLMTVLDVLELK